MPPSPYDQQERRGDEQNLQHGGQTWPDRQVAAYDSRPGFLHGFAVSRGSDKDLANSNRTPDYIHSFRAHRDGKFMTALIYELKTGQITVRTPAEVHEELDGEFAFWAAGIDSLDSDKKGE